MMFSIWNKLNIFLIDCINELFPGMSLDVMSKMRLSKGKNADYQFNYLMLLSKVLGLDQSKIAARLTEKLLTHSYIESISISGSQSNTFMNIAIKTSVVARYLNEIYGSVAEFDFRPKQSNGKKVIVDYSSPNIAKEMHVGHLRSTIIGESIRRIYQFQGYLVEGVNHLGDWGTQFGMLIAYLKKNHIHQYGLSDLIGMYRESKKLFDSDPDFKVQAYKETVLLQSGDETNTELWNDICQVSEIGFNAIYDQLDVNIEIKGESFYQSRMQDTLIEFGDKIIEQDGMKIIFPTGHSVPFILQKSDGGFTYDTSDLTALMYRIREESANKIIYVVDLSQQEHFKQLFQLAQDLKICDPDKLSYAGFGMVSGADGKKLRARSGETIRLQDLLDQAYEQAEEVTKSLAQEKHPDWSEEIIKSTSKIIAISSIKYADLSNPKESNYKFSPKKMMDHKGNTGVYILYAYARCTSIIKKVDDFYKMVLDGTDIQVCTKHEICLAKKLMEFVDAVNLAETELAPHIICNYMYDLVGTFGNFYDNDKCIEQNPDHSIKSVNVHRLKLTHMTQLVLGKCLDLVGMDYVDSM
jgi:arginyl-tRNA synthetase